MGSAQQSIGDRVATRSQENTSGNGRTRCTTSFLIRRLASDHGLQREMSAAPTLLQLLLSPREDKIQ